MNIRNRVKFITFILYIAVNKITAQDIINPYLNWEGVPTASFGNLNYNLVNTPCQFYSGEYEISLESLPFGNEAALYGSVSGQIDILNFLVTDEIEVVSFPFVNNCAFPSSAGQNPDCSNFVNRDLMLPSGVALPQKWQYPQTSGFASELRKNIELDFSGNVRWLSRLQMCVLSTATYCAHTISEVDHVVFPQTIIKHTIRLHCGLDSQDPVLTEFSFIVDNTRGKMREYPFVSPNNSICNDHNYDLVIIPQVISTLTYDDNSRCDYYSRTMTGATGCTDPDQETTPIIYTPFDLMNDAYCHSINPDYTIPVTSLTDDFYPQLFYHLPLASNSLVFSVFPRSGRGEVLAGYTKNTTTNVLESIVANGITQNYFIDRRIQLEDINTDEKIIYNPSEASITAPDFYFPANYTFKTLHATYPFESELASANTIENGGIYTDYKDIPVVTDLRKDWHVSGYNDTDPCYASIYHLLNGSSLTIQPCVRIFDATFESQPGSSLLFENWKTNINHDRYKIIYDGGLVSKTDDEFYFQNESESRRILEFRSGTFIKAGNNVTSTIPSGDYTLQTGADLSLVASQYVSLEPGFSTEVGSTFLASTDNVIVAQCPPQRKRNPNLSNGINQGGEEFNVFDFFQNSPNPVNESTHIMFGLSMDAPVSVRIYDDKGLLISEIASNVNLKKGRYSYTIDSSKLNSGVYFVNLTSNSSSRNLKFIKIN
ncbi:MAG: T9SS type A sorting domain-containing protein [Bacteroidia bacterium]